MEISKNINNHFKEHGIQPSFQRLKVFEYLLNHKTHPTADTIYKALKNKIPSLSKTTIYNTLKLFVDKGMAQALTIDEGETRYDAEMSLHGHFKCEICGNVFDFETELPKIKFDHNENININEYHIYLKGKCSKCNTIK